MNDFLGRGQIQWGPAKVSFHRWVYPVACSYSPGVSSKRFRLSGLPPSCWHTAAATFFLRGLGLVSDILEKRRLGNELLQLLVLIDVRRDLTLPDFLIVHFEEKVFIGIVSKADDSTPTVR